MSGLEPLAALGLACNVFQVISFAGEICTVSKAIFKQGQVPELTAGVDVAVDSLNGVLDQIKTAVGPIHGQRQLTDNDRELLRIAQECHAAAVALKDEIDKLARRASSAQGNALKSLFAGLKVSRHSRTKQVDKLEKMLQRHQTALETRLLSRICSKTDAISLRQGADFATVDSTLQGFVQAYAEGERRMEQLLTREVASVKQHVTDEAAKLKATLIDDAAHIRLLQSLKYNTMNERRNQISTPHATTFEWIWGGIDEDSESSNASDEDSDDEYQRDLVRYSSLQKNAQRDASSGFLLWLQSPDQSLFWISGKPGSGKSTFMKYLANDPRTTQNLPSNPSGEPLVLSHFIWSAGELMERRIKGILCSLLRQLIEQNQGALVELIITRFPQARIKDSPSDWNEEELEQILTCSIQSSSETVCIFLDGLDEIDPGLQDGQLRLLGLLDRLCSQVRALKLCVASRPEPILEKALSRAPTIRIHDLTTFDIWKFASSVLWDQSHSRSKIEPARRHLLIRVCDMAEGVFLWVALVLRMLQDGMDHGDDLSDLQKRLDTLPRDLEMLYKTMWDRLGESKSVYQQDGATYLNIVLIYSHMLRYSSYKGPTILDIMMGADSSIFNAIISGEAKSPTKLRELSQKGQETARRLKIRSVGLLEVDSETSPSLDTRVRFIHRSAKDFVERTAQGQSLLQFDTLGYQDRQLSTLKAFIASSFFFWTLNKRPRDVQERWTNSEFIMSLVWWLSRAPYREHYSIKMEMAVELYGTIERLYMAVSPGPTRDWDCWACPKSDFLLLAAFVGVADVVKEKVEQMRKTAPLSVRYKRRLLVAALCPPRGPFEKEKLQSKVGIANYILQQPIESNYCDIQFTEIFDNVVEVPRFLYPVSPIESIINCALQPRYSSTASDHRLLLAPLMHKILRLGASLAHPVLLEITQSYMGSDSILSRLTPVRPPGLEITSGRNKRQVFLEASLGAMLDILLARFQCGVDPKKHDGGNAFAGFADMPGTHQIHKIIMIETTPDNKRHYSTTNTAFTTRIFECLCTAIPDDSFPKHWFYVPGLRHLLDDIAREVELSSEEDIIADLLARDRIWRWDDPRTFAPSPYEEDPPTDHVDNDDVVTEEGQ
ncbi:hypothetical protein QBC44DRAFT_376015 [Cladorrhinum sp. PSN332]|nr:hypothetical protein QBC44DRAFT_376015 [Cladorrhinum sp. PSN332]